MFLLGEEVTFLLNNAYSFHFLTIHQDNSTHISHRGNRIKTHAIIMISLWKAEKKCDFPYENAFFT